jgi:Tfp pilus assembly protein PilE
MMSRTVRVLMVALVVAALAGAGYFAYKIEVQMRADRAAVSAYEAQVRQTSQMLSGLDAAQRGYVADGQSSDRWQTQVTSMARAASANLSDVRLATKAADAQAAVETAIETMAAFGKADAKARDYVSSGQKLSASDVIFADGHDAIYKAVAALEEARAKEVLQLEAAMSKQRKMQAVYVGGALGVTLLVVVLLVPVPKPQPGALDADPLVAMTGLGDIGSTSPGVMLGRGESPKQAPPSQNISKAADVCAALARVQGSHELPSLLERAADSLDATGLIIWMSEGFPAKLRPVLAHGYSPATLTRMGVIDPDADNATATAFRTQSTQVMPTEPNAGGALVVPMVVADGCTGAMAIELKKGVEPHDDLKSIATILAAQLATLITPAPVGNATRPKG